MKYIWQPSDIKPGIFVCKHFSYQGNDRFIPCGNSLKWTYLIGFCPSTRRVIKDGEEYYNTISMADGMIMKQKTKEEICEIFNCEELIPMPFKWLRQSLEWNTTGYYTV